MYDYAYHSQVVKDFEYHFPTINSNGLTENWSQISGIPAVLERKKIEKAWTKITDKNDDLRHFLEYMVLLTSNKPSFEKAIESLFIFNEV